jgi:hypothetical protein
MKNGKKPDLTRYSGTAECCAAFLLLLQEGFAVGALVLGWVVLVGTHQNAVQGAVVVAAAVVRTLLHRAGDAVVGIAAGLTEVVRVHGIDSFF